MLPNKVIKAGVEHTCYGLAVVLMVDGQRTLAFPDQIDSTDGEAIDNWHPTICWPMGEPLSRIREFPPGPLLPGWDVLGACAGKIGEDPWKEYGTVQHGKTNPDQYDSYPSDTCTSPDTLEHPIKTAFDYSERVLAKMNRPFWFRVFIEKLRHTRLLERRR